MSSVQCEKRGWTHFYFATGEEKVDSKLSALLIFAFFVDNFYVKKIKWL